MPHYTTPLSWYMELVNNRAASLMDEGWSYEGAYEKARKEYEDMLKDIEREEI